MSKADLTGSAWLTGDFAGTVRGPNCSDSAVSRRCARCRLPDAACPPVPDQCEDDHQDECADREQLEVQLRNTPHVVERVLEAEEALNGAREDRDPRTQ